MVSGALLPPGSPPSVELAVDNFVLTKEAEPVPLVALSTIQGVSALWELGTGWRAVRLCMHYMCVVFYKPRGICVHAHVCLCT